MWRKKSKLDDSDTRNLTIAQNLEGAVHSLTEANKTIGHTLNALMDFTKDSHRQAHATQCEISYELVTQEEIVNASHELIPDLVIECRNLLERVNQHLFELKKKETKLKEVVKGKDAMIEKLKHDINNVHGNSRVDIVDNEKRLGLSNTKERLIEEIAREKKRKAAGLANLKKLKASNEEALNKQKEGLLSSEGWQQYQTNSIKEIAQLKSEHIRKQKELQEKKRLKEREADEAYSERKDLLTTKESIATFTEQLKTIQNAMSKLRESGTTASVTQCEQLCDGYLGALHRETETSPIELGPSKIEKIKTLCRLLLANRMSGKTTGRIIELLLSKGEVGIEIFLEEFPWTEDERHNFANVTINL
ncbi:hypothetical protein INT47_002045 [Mucor saturninus]|uniref:Uncharacterized protein n=1 Tax=Mucor saturninus TaxID=64648 RepID=A0A8H7UZQ7_9FUNG|nr:hypothetical protein INT47_002045 [Mucor saturninus]